jgi:hypothetical protein
MVPRQMRETLRPVLPRRTFSTRISQKSEDAF